jgi:hypothetical protein
MCLEVAGRCREFFEQKAFSKQMQNRTPSSFFFLSFDMTKFQITDSAYGLRYLHEHNVVHGDLKAV